VPYCSDIYYGGKQSRRTLRSNAVASRILFRQYYYIKSFGNRQGAGLKKLATKCRYLAAYAIGMRPAPLRLIAHIPNNADQSAPNHSLFGWFR